MSSRRSQLVLLGMGHGHLNVLRQWREHVRKGVELTVITPNAYALPSTQLAPVVSGSAVAADEMIDLAALITASGARWIQDSCAALDVQARTISLRQTPEQKVHFDWLSINTGASMALSQLEAAIPGARGRALPVRPMERFVDYWERAIDSARTRPVAISVIGGGLGGLTLALAAKRRVMREHAMASVTLLTGGPHWLGGPRARLHRLARRALARAHIQVLEHRCVAMADGELQLDNGLRLQCDLPIVATGNQPPTWLADSGLHLDARGFIKVNASQQSTSHLRVFALGDIATRVDRPQPRNADYAQLAAHNHAQTLWAAIQGMALPTKPLPRRRLETIDTSDGRRIARWGRWSLAGRWVNALLA